MIRRYLILLGTAGLLALTGCGPIDASTGELANGRFAYQCVDSSDAACDGFAGTAALPALLAVGGIFDLTYTGDSAEGAPVQMEPASNEMISPIGGALQVLRPGVSAVLARSTTGVVSDFIHLRAVSIDHLDVAGPSSTKAVTQVQMDTDNEVDLQVAPKDDSGASLAGAFPYEWSSSDATVVSLRSLSRNNRVTLTALKAGTATVEVSLPGGMKMAVAVTAKQGTGTSTSTSGSGGSGSSTGSSSGAGGAGGGQ